MVDIWKIGARPGLWKKNPQSRKEGPREDKVKKEKRFINDYALKYNFVAMGSAYVQDSILDLISKNSLRDSIKKGWDKNEKLTDRKLDVRKYMLNDFANIVSDDIILLYFIGETPRNGEIYVGEAIKKDTHPYYYVKLESNENMIEDTVGIHIAPHRVKVNWLFSENRSVKSFPADFSNGNYRRRIHQLSQKDIDITIKSKQLKDFLKNKFNNS